MNMRKIIAVLSAVLMLCSIIPMAALSVSAAGSFDFENGTVSGWQSGCTIEVVDDNGSKVLKWDASGADWANVYYYGSSMVSANTDYVVSFRAKADRSTNMNFKVNNNWASDTAKLTVDVTTEWQEYSNVLNSGACTSGALLLFSSNTTASNGATYYIDDIVIEEYVEPAEPGVIINGDFSTTDGWTLGNGATIADGVLKLDNPGQWSEAALQSIPAKANTNYEITWKSQRVSGTGVFNLFVMDASNVNLTKVSGQNWMNETTGNWVDNSYTINTGSSETIKIKFSTESTSPGIIWIDDFQITEIKDPSYDGYIYNGDFEIGKITSWTNLYDWTTVEMVEGYNSDYAIKGTSDGAWRQVYQAVTVEPNTNYTICAYSKDSTSAALWIKSAGGSSDIASAALNSGSDWALTTLTFNSGSNSSVWVGLMAQSAGATYTVDNVLMYEAVEQSNDGYIINGNFETAVLSPWSLIWSSQISASIVSGGKDSNWAITATGLSAWGQVRQSVAVEPNTNYKVSVWAKNVNGMSLLIKDGGDSTNIINKSIASSTDWTETVVEFNSGDYTSVLVGVMVNSADSYGTFDNFVMEKTACSECTYDSCEDDTCDVCGNVREAGTCVSDAEYECTDGVCTVCGAAVAGTGHNYYYACDAYCEICYELTNESAAHSITHVEAVAATCTENGNIEYWTCEYCGGCWDNENGTGMPLNRMMVIEWASHTYDDDYDVDCNVCGDIRVVEYEVSSFGGNSISEDVSGLAYKFDVAVDGMGIKAGKYTQADYTNATVTPNSESGALKLVGMGAVVSNNWGITYLDYVDGAHVVDVPVVYLCDLEADSASYAVRVINIPESAYDTYITARPYYVYEDAEGNEVVVYGYEEMATYNGVLEG